MHNLSSKTPSNSELSSQDNLEGAISCIIKTEKDSEHIKILLEKDFEHFSQSFFHNEDVGEKRFNFFITVVTSVIAGIVALHTIEESKAKLIFPTPANSLKEIRCNGLAVLIIFSFLTYLRMLKRRIATHRYLKVLSEIRNIVYKDSQLSTYTALLKPTHKTLEKYSAAGYAETVGVITGILCSAYVYFSITSNYCVVYSIGFLVGGVLWWFTCYLKE